MTESIATCASPGRHQLRRRGPAAAGLLLVASLSHSAVAVSAAVVVQQLPKLLFAGALVDRLPRRAVLVAANLARAAVLGMLALTVLAGEVRLGLFYCALFVMGVGESLADTAYGAVLVCVVGREALGRANARLALTLSLNNQLLGPPLGALAFAVLWALPFAFAALAFALAGLLIAPIAQAPPPPRRPPPVRGRSGSGLARHTAVLVHAAPRADLDGVGAPQRARDHARLHQFQAAEAAFDRLGAA